MQFCIFCGSYRFAKRQENFPKQFYGMIMYKTKMSENIKEINIFPFYLIS